MRYQVRTLSQKNEIGRIFIDAQSENDARQQVHALGLKVATINPHKSWAGLSNEAKLPKNFVLLFSQELLALLRAGLSIVECLEALSEKETHVATNQTLAQLLQNLHEGKRFSVALKEQTHVFSLLYVGIIQAAEGTSDLPRSLERYIDYQQRLDQVRNKIISAAIYPMILLAVGGLVTFFLVGYVVPRFAEVYQGSGRDLPWLSQLILEWGKFAQTHIGMVLFSIFALTVSLVLFIRHLNQTGALARILDRIPGIGERRHIYELSRLYLTLGMLLEGGIPVTQALDTVSAILKFEMRNNLASAKSAIESGNSFSLAFQSNNLVTPISLRMLRVGERSGELGLMLSQSAAFYDGEVQRWIDRFTRSFEPILMAAIGIVVGTIVVLLYMPIFDLAGNLS